MDNSRADHFMRVAFQLSQLGSAQIALEHVRGVYPTNMLAQAWSTLADEYHRLGAFANESVCRRRAMSFGLMVRYHDGMFQVANQLFI